MILPFFSTLSLLSCQSNDDIEINGDLKDPHSYLEGKMLYLGNEEIKKFEDSTIIKDGKFKFHIKPKADFAPFRASILYSTGNPASPYNGLGFKNPFFKKTFESNFYVERGKVDLVKDRTFIINGKKLTDLVFVDINKQTAFAFKHVYLQNDSKKPEKTREHNRSLVSQYPYSVELLRHLDQNKASFQESEVKYLVSLFDESVKTSRFYKSLSGYLKYENSSGTAFPTDITLKRPDKSLSNNALDSKSKYNLVVFWASWCGPCRMEIPQIKKLYAKHKNELNIVSISIDKQEDWWRKAMEKENMPWNQYLVDSDSSFIKLDKKYNLQAIPVWVLLDANNNLIDQRVGMSEGDDAIDQRVAAHITK